MSEATTLQNPLALYTNCPQSNTSRKWNDVIMNEVKAVDLEFKKLQSVINTKHLMSNIMSRQG